MKERPIALDSEWSRVRPRLEELLELGPVERTARLDAIERDETAVPGLRAALERWLVLADECRDDEAAFDVPAAGNARRRRLLLEVRARLRRSGASGREDGVT